MSPDQTQTPGPSRIDALDGERREAVRWLLVSLQKHADLDTKAWWEGYVKDSAPFLGVKMATIRAQLHAWHRERVDERFDLPAQVDLALALFEGEHSEEKLAGTLFLQEILLPRGGVDILRDLERLAALFDSGSIADWNVCDWFCVKALGPLIRRDGRDCAERISAWRDAENLWRARASLVAFVNLAGHEPYYPLIETACQVVLRRPERFAKTAVGWVLREVSRHDEDLVIRIIDSDLRHFSTESLRNATKHFEPEARSQAMRTLKSERGSSA